MSALINGTMEGITYLFDDLGDPRVKNWWLMSTPGPIVTILATYLYFCIYLGPQYMKDKKPLEFKNVLKLYNLFQIAMSIFLTYRGIEYAYKTNYSFTCQQVDYSDTPESVKWAANVWWYFVAKITELLDTVFFVLRKKDNQVSFLHLYHHTVMPLLSWFGTKYTAGGQAIPEGTINAFIHIIMYGYYFIAGLGPQFQKYLWWKKHVTTLQLIQFCIVLYLNVTGFFTPNCNYPKYLNVFVTFNCLAFLYMFGMFYYRSYVNNNKNNSNRNQKKES